MPSGIKATLSLVVLVGGVIAYLFDKQDGNEQLGWVSVGLALFMVLAMWIFPETGSRKGNK
jgi:Na+/phosphate symporter